MAGYTQQEYLDEIKKLLESGTDLYEHMTIELHNQGLILMRKYNLLAYAHQVFMYGFIFSVMVFLGLLVWGSF